MNLFELIINNAWVVGIGTGVIVYLLTSVITNKFSRKGRIAKANKIIINTLRGYIVNNGVPSETVFNAIKNVMASEYKVTSKELLETKELCECLIAEIIGNTYIPTDNQKSSIEVLEKWIEQNGVDKKTTNSYEIPGRFFELTNILEVILAIISVILTFLVRDFF